MRHALALGLALAACCAPLAAAQAPTGVAVFGNAPGTLRLPEALAVAPDGRVLVGDHFSGRVQVFRDGRPDGALAFSGDVCGRLGAVSGIARSADGRVFVLDADRQRVHVFGADGRLVRCFGGRGSGRGRLRTSSGAYAASSASGGIAVAGRHVYVADHGNHRVQRFTLDGRDPKVLGRGRLSMPQGVAVRGRRLLVADDGNHRLVELTTAGRFVRATRAGTGRGRLRFPYDVALARNGHAYVADNNGHRVVQLDRRLRRVRSWGGFGRGRTQFVFPRAIAVGPGGHVFVADAANDRVTEFTAAGRYVRTLGANGRRAGAVSAPADVAVNGRGEVAVADANARISWFDLRGGYLGRWAQGRSFQESTAVVHGPASLGFAADDRVQVVDGSRLIEFAPGAARALVDAGPTGGVQARAIDRAGDTTWILRARGRFAALGADGRLGPDIGEEDPPDRTSTDLTVLADGSIAIAEATSENRVRRDGLVRRYDAAGRRLSTWPLARPPGGEPTAPAGLVSDGAGGAWVSDATNGRVVRLGAGGRVLDVLGAPGPETGRLAVPAGLALDCDGGLLVADRGNNRVVRYAGIAERRGCAPRPVPPTAAAKLPAPVGLRLDVRERARRPARRLATIRATCARSCTLDAEASGGTFGSGRATRIRLTARVTGTTIRISAGDRALRRLRAGVRAGGSATAGVLVRATARDGVVDTATSTITFR